MGGAGAGARGGSLPFLTSTRPLLSILAEHVDYHWGDSSLMMRIGNDDIGSGKLLQYDCGNDALGSYDVDPDNDVELDSDKDNPDDDGADNDDADHNDDDADNYEADEAYTEHRSVSSLAEGFLPTSHLCPPFCLVFSFSSFSFFFSLFFLSFFLFPFVVFFRELIIQKKLHIGVVQTTKGERRGREEGGVSCIYLIFYCN